MLVVRSGLCPGGGKSVFTGGNTVRVREPLESPVTQNAGMREIDVEIVTKVSWDSGLLGRLPRPLCRPFRIGDLAEDVTHRLDAGVS